MFLSTSRTVLKNSPYRSSGIKKRLVNKMLPFTLFIVMLDPIVQRRANLHMNKKRNF